jgi:acetoin utilization deacetylase AcuC-like enzyme
VAAPIPSSIRALARATRRAARRVRSLLGEPRLRVVYHEGYRPPDTDVVDARRADRIITYLAHEGWLHEATVLAPPDLAVSALAKVHDRAYLESLDGADAVARAMGTPSIGPEDASRLLDAQRRATAGTVLATALALRAPSRGPVANLGGGFHHARRDRGAGFCLFNDVAVAIEEARASGFGGRVLVVDLDLHHGDGTRRIFSDDDRVLTFSIHAEPWDTEPAVASLDVALGPGVGDATYLRALGDALPEAFDRARPDLVIYVAGVDVAYGDRLGGWRLGADAILERDERVLELAGSRPTVMVLAGGYGPDAWRLSARTLARILGSDGAPIPTEAEASLLQFRRLRAKIDPAALAEEAGPDGFGFTEDDIFGELVQKKPEPRLLGSYSRFGVEVMMEHFGLAAHLRARGYPKFVVTLVGDAPTGPTVVVHADARRREVLIELGVAETVLPSPDPADGAPLRLASIEWLLLQDPRARPDPARPLLPGQRHPGLGCLRIVVGMLVMACERLGLDGLTFVPSQLHVAARGRALGTFLDPVDEGRWARIESLAADPSAGPAAAAALFVPARMVLPVSTRLRAALGSVAYARRVEAAARAAAAPLDDASSRPIEA